MYGKIDPLLDSQNDDSSSAFTTLFLLTGLAVAVYAIVRVAEANNRLNYESRTARIIAGFLVLMMRLMHTKSGDLELEEPAKSIIALGPHRTGWEAVAVAAKMKKEPPRFFATTAYNSIPGVGPFLEKFKAIPVDAHATKGDKGQSANAGALEQASKALSENGCVAIFPQGNFAKLGQEPPRVYAGAARLSIQNSVPIHVFRIDGFWSLENPLIPLFIRNNSYYRAFFSAFHMNNIRVKFCRVIDFHLKPENKNLSEEEKIDGICAQLYAYYRHTPELTDKQVEKIELEIEKKTHLLIWKNKVKQDELGKQLQTLKKEAEELGGPTLALMNRGGS